jgi:hypothetical protein
MTERAPLILERGAPSRRRADDYDVLENGVVVGRIFVSPAAPPGRPWMWASGHSAATVKRARHGYEATREAAMAAFREELAQKLEVHACLARSSLSPSRYFCFSSLAYSSTLLRDLVRGSAQRLHEHERDEDNADGHGGHGCTADNASGNDAYDVHGVPKSRLVPNDHFQYGLISGNSASPTRESRCQLNAQKVVLAPSASPSRDSCCGIAS